MKILCISVHPVLEYDDIIMFERMGHRIFSLGFYLHREINNGIRPILVESEWHAECLKVFEQTGCSMTTDPATWLITTPFVDLFDTIIVHHNRHFIAHHWPLLKNRLVIWRTIGQELHWAEDFMRPFREEGLRIVRWSPEERFIQGYIGEDAMIRAGKNPADWSGWIGETRRILTFNNDFIARREGLNYDFHKFCVEDLPFDLYGLRNDDHPNWRGMASPIEQVQHLRSYRAAFITGTYPAPYTLGFIEAWMTGIPVIHIGRMPFAGKQRGVYEIDSLLRDGVDGFLVNTPLEAKRAFQLVLNDMDLCKAISVSARKQAIRYFGICRAMEEWTALFSSLGVVA